jgi:hypothetical protein
MRGYSVNAVASTNGARTLLLLEASSSRALIVQSIRVGNRDNNTAERWQVAVHRVSTKGTPAGTSLTIKPLSPADAASNATALGFLTTEPTSYEADPLLAFGETNLVGIRWQAMRDTELYIPPSGLIGVRLLNTIANTSIAVNVVFLEVP